MDTALGDGVLSPLLPSDLVMQQTWAPHGAGEHSLHAQAGAKEGHPFSPFSTSRKTEKAELDS